MSDLKWLTCGDYVTISGDFDETEDIVSYELQETLSRVKSSESEFLLESNEIACNIETYLGQPVSKDTAKSIRERVVHALSYYGYLSPNSKIEVKALVLNDESIGVYLKLSNSEYEDIYINVYMDFDGGTSSILVEESGDVHYTQ